jgi:hypothetical protein
MFMSDRSAVDEYLRTFAAFDWDGFSRILADENLRRVGPFMDVIETKEDYVDFLSHLMPTLINYEVRVDRISECGSKRFLVELSEIFDVDGVRTEYPQADLFEVDGTDKICGVSIFMKVPASQAPVSGANADHR